MEEVTNFLVDVMAEADLIAFASNLGTAWVSYQQQQGVPVAAISAAMATETNDGASGLDPGSAEGIMASPQYSNSIGELTTRIFTIGREYRRNASVPARQQELAAEALAILRVLALRDNYNEQSLIGVVEGTDEYSVPMLKALAEQAAREQFARENGGRQPWRNPMEHPVVLSIVIVVAILALGALYVLIGLPPFGN